jgi:Ca2+-transporting ATPase
MESDKSLRVLRDGHDRDINVHDLLVGDIVYINQGDAVPADGMLIVCNQVEVDQSNVTGESDLVKKHTAI